MRYFTYSFAYKRMFFMSRKMAFRKQVLSSITAEDPMKSEKWIKSQETRSTSALWHSVVSFNLVLVFLSFIFFAPQTFHLSLWNSSKSAVLENNINHSLQLLLQGGGNCSSFSLRRKHNFKYVSGWVLTRPAVLMPSVRSSKVPHCAH